LGESLNLPRLRLLLVVLLLVVFVVLVVLVAILFVELVLVIIDDIVINDIVEAVDTVVVVCHDADSGVGFVAAGTAAAAVGGLASAAGFGFGGGYVDQKWRPQVGHTQNCSGVHSMPGAGSRNSICAPQRWQRMWMSTSLIREF
jgi:hypothetical protein